MSWLLVLALPVALAQTPDLLPEVVTPSVETTWEAHHRAVGLAGDAADVVCADFAEGLRVCLRVREGPGTRPVTQADLDRWGLDPTAAQARAIRSIARGMTPDRPAEIQVEGEALVSFIPVEEVEDLLRIRKSQTRGLVVIPPGDPFLLAYKSRYQEPTADGSREGVVVQDGRVAATWNVGRTAAPVRFLDGGNRGRILKEIQGVLARAGVGLEAVPEDDAPES